MRYCTRCGHVYDGPTYPLACRQVVPVGDGTRPCGGAVVTPPDYLDDEEEE